MVTVCTCSHSIDAHGMCGGKCEVCTCHCFRGAKRFPKSCRYPLRDKWNSPRDFDAPEMTALIYGGVDNTLRALLAEEEKAS